MWVFFLNFDSLGQNFTKQGRVYYSEGSLRIAQLLAGVSQPAAARLDSVVCGTDGLVSRPVAAIE